MDKLKVIAIPLPDECTAEDGYLLADIAEVIIGTTLSYISDSPFTLIQEVKFVISSDNMQLWQVTLTYLSMFLIAYL